MQIDERGQHGEELFVDKDTLGPLARAPSTWHSSLVPRHEPSTRAGGLRLKSSTHRPSQTRSPGHQPLQQCPSLSENQKGRILRSPEQWWSKDSTLYWHLPPRIKPRRSALCSLQRVSSLRAGSLRAHFSNESSGAPSYCEQLPNSRSRRSSQPSQALQPPQTFERLLQVVNMSEDDREPDLESEEETLSDDESCGQNGGAGSSMVSGSSKNEED